MGSYTFYVGQHVDHVVHGWHGEITARLPGAGTDCWYAVTWEGPDGSPQGETTESENMLQAAWTPPGARPRQH